MTALARTSIVTRLAGRRATLPRRSSVVARVNIFQQRHVTNATKIEYVPDLHQVPRVEAKDGGWRPTLVHSSGDTKFTVIRLDPNGGEVPIHYHNKVWDYFLPMEGEAVIETETKDGVKNNYEVRPGSFLAVPPEDIHRVRNKSKDKEFVFFIVQSPRHQYDFIGKS